MNEPEGYFDVGVCYDRKTVTVDYKCCDGNHEPGVEIVHLTPEKAVYMANLLLEKVLNLYWTKKEEKPDDPPSERPPNE